MKKFAVFIFTLLIFCSAISVEASRKTIAVMPLENASKYEKINVAEIMTEELMIALQNSGKYSVLERTQITTVLKEQGFQNMVATQSSAVEIGKLTGASYSLIGKVTMVDVGHPVAKKLHSIFGKGNDVKGKINIDVRFIDNETGELIFAKSFHGEKEGESSEEALHNACKEAAENFLNELTSDLTGRIVDVTSKEIYIDKGNKNGIRKGDIFLIFRETSPIEVNGKIVDMKKIQIGKAKVIEVNAEYSICKIVSDKKKFPIQKGDVVKKE